MLQYDIIMNIFRNRRFIFTLLLSLALNIAQWVVLYIFIPQPAPGSDFGVILHYNFYFGVDSIGEWYKIFYIPASGLACIILNTVLAVWIHKREELLSLVLEFSASILQVLLAISTALLIISNLP